MRLGLLLVCLLIAACSPGSDPPPATAPSPPASAPPSAPAAPPPVPVRAPAEEIPAVASPTEAALAARRAAAEEYLDAAREQAEQRQRDAKARCEAGVDDYEACIAGADQVYEAEMRSVRVEFDARMSEPPDG